MRILVTGKNGALGKAIMKLSVLNTFPHAEFIFTDSKSLELTNKKQVEDFFHVNKPNYVLHLASKSGVAKLNESIPAEIFDTNMTMSMNILSAASKNNVSKIVLVSSSAAYPAQLGRSAQESDLHAGSPRQLDFAYAYAKRMMDPLAQAYRNQFDMKVSVAIVNGIVGPYMNFKPNESFMLAGMIRRFCEQKISEARSSNYQVFGNSKAEREYTYSEDLAKAILWLVSQNKMPPLINLGNNLNLSIKDYAEIICDCLEIDKDLLEFSGHFNQISDLNNFLTDNSLFISLSNFQYTDIYEAVDNTITWFRKNYNL